VRVIATGLLVALAVIALSSALRTGVETAAGPAPVPSTSLPQAAVPGPSGFPLRLRPAPARPTPTATQTPATTVDPLAVLQRNELYRLSVRPSCPEQRLPGNEAAFQAQVLALVACLDTVWETAFRGTSVTFSAPAVVFYGESLLTVCGTLGSEFPAMYCPLNSTLYFSAEASRESWYYRLATTEVSFHEYSHHLQRLAGIDDALLMVPETMRGLRRRVELQAHCLAMYQLANSDIGITRQDHADLEYQFAWSADVEGHGSARARTLWGRRGLRARTPGACNTWTATDRDVR
jgi:predicted metalloprotease